MAKRHVTASRKDENGDITHLCCKGKSWSPRTLIDVISDIELDHHEYYVPWKKKETKIHVVNGPIGKYLRSNHDGVEENNLDNLPDC